MQATITWRHWTGASLTAVILVFTALLALLGRGASADVPHAGLNFAIGVDTNGDTVDDCDTDAATGATASCVLGAGASFDVSLYVTSLGGITYAGFDSSWTYTGPTASQTQTYSWPDCTGGFPASFYGANAAGVGCAQGISATTPSTYSGRMVTLDFTCAASGTIAIVHGPGGTGLTDDVGSEFHGEAASGSEALTITCGGGGVTPTQTPATSATATSTTAATATSTTGATSTPSATLPSGGATNTPTATMTVGTPDATPTASPTATSGPSATATTTLEASPTATPVDTTPTATALASPTPSSTMAASATPTRTFTPTFTPTRTFTPTNTPTNTPTRTPTRVPTETPTPLDATDEPDDDTPTVVTAATRTPSSSVLGGGRGLPNTGNGSHGTDGSSLWIALGPLLLSSGLVGLGYWRYRMDLSQ